jgi:glycosyltransferase involved in cell wall biosynthesis
VALASAPFGALRGALDAASRTRIAGWAQDAADGERPVGLVVEANGTVIGRILANRYRADLAAAGIGSGRHSFELALPIALSALEAHQIRILREADGAELPGSPVMLPAASAFDAGLKESLDGILARLDSDTDEGGALAFLTGQTDRLLARRAERHGRRGEREALRLHRRRWGGSAGDEPAVSSGRRALVVDDQVPAASRDAGSVAILSHMRALRALGYEVSFVAAQEIADGASAARLAAAEGIAVCGAPYYSCVEDVLCRQAGTFDLVYLHRAANADSYLSLARRHSPKARIVYSVADLHHLRLARQAQVERRPELLAFSRRMAASEMLAAKRADIVLTHSSVEAELLRREAGFGKVHVVPFAVAPRRARRPFAERRGIAFLGGAEHAPNPDAVHHLVHDILPLVWAQDPTLTCTIVGHGWHRNRLPAIDPRVEWVGPVEDLDAVLHTVRLTVAPLRFGAGIKGKVLDSFAAALPCVMTPIAAEGLPLTATLQGLVGPDAAALAERIVHLHADPAANQAIGDAAARLVAAEFCLARVSETLREALQGMTAPTRRSANDVLISAGS